MMNNWQHLKISTFACLPAQKMKSFQINDKIEFKDNTEYEFTVIFRAKSDQEKMIKMGSVEGVLEIYIDQILIDTMDAYHCTAFRKFRIKFLA